MVKRYGELVIDSAPHSRMAEIKNGPWVEYADYKAKVDALTALADEIVAMWHASETGAIEPPEDWFNRYEAETGKKL
jgi:hypothetical protein